MLFLKTFKDAKFVVDGNALVANKRVGNSAAEMTARDAAGDASEHGAERRAGARSRAARS